MLILKDDDANYGYKKIITEEWGVGGLGGGACKTHQGMCWGTDTIMTLQALHAAGVRPAVGAHLERSCHLRLRPGSCCETHVQLLQNGQVQIRRGNCSRSFTWLCVMFCSLLAFLSVRGKHVRLPTLLRNQPHVLLSTSPLVAGAGVCASSCNSWHGHFMCAYVAEAGRRGREAREGDDSRLHV